MIAAQAVLTSRGGKTSHAAVVARGMGKVCVCGAEEIDVDPRGRRFSVGGRTVEEGSVISVDGSEGAVHPGAVPLVDSAVMRYFEAGLETGTDTGVVETGEGSAGLVDAVARAMQHADSVRRPGIRANADTPEDAARARRFGAEGIGLCRTEHMFLGDRRQLVEAMILARDDAARERALDALLPLQRQDFVGILEVMDGLPVTIRLLDPPLHEFLPDRTELAVRLAAAEAHGTPPSAHDAELLQAVNRMHEENPMLGLRGVLLGLVAPGLVAMQVRAIAEAVVERKRTGGDPRAEIMVPLIDTVEELRLVRAERIPSPGSSSPPLLLPPRTGRTGCRPAPGSGRARLSRTAGTAHGSAVWAVNRRAGPGLPRRTAACPTPVRSAHDGKDRGTKPGPWRGLPEACRFVGGCPERCFSRPPAVSARGSRPRGGRAMSGRRARRARSAARWRRWRGRSPTGRD